MVNPAQSTTSVQSHLQSNELYGIHPAVVEFASDPECRGRVKVRVYNLHGPQGTDEKTRIPTEDLPWAMPCFPPGGGYDFGNFVVPPIGASVWVMFVGGDSNQPVYMGSWYSVNKEPDKYLRSMGKPETDISMAGGSDQWSSPKGSEVPSDALEMVHASPEISVPAKSIKGATLLFNDRDEHELTALIDRSGAGLFLESEINKTPNKNNSKQRRARLSALRGSPAVDIAQDTIASETRLMLIDAGGQSLVLHTHKGSERIKLVSRIVEDDNSNFAGAKDEMALELDAGSKRITLSSTIGGQSKTKVVIDAASGFIEILGPTTIKLSAQVLELLGKCVVKGDLIVHGDTLLNNDVTVVGQVTGGSK